MYNKYCTIFLSLYTLTSRKSIRLSTRYLFITTKQYQTSNFLITQIGKKFKQN